MKILAYLFGELQSRDVYWVLILAFTKTYHTMLGMIANYFITPSAQFTWKPEY